MSPDETSPSPDSKQVDDDETSKFVDLPRSIELDPVSAIRITAAEATRLIAIVGPADSGKTTLLASLYERFLRQKSFGGYCFSGSDTLLGFEQRCHLARQSSGLKSPDTERTPTTRVDNISLLHLSLRKEDLSKSNRSLLFTDIAGEIFRHAKDSTEFCKTLTFLRRTDHVVMLIDGSDLTLPDKRQVAIFSARDFIRRTTDANMLRSTALVDIVITKWDTIDSKPNGEQQSINAFVELAKGQLRDQFSSQVASMRFVHVAARPYPPSQLPMAYGLDNLLGRWVEESSLYPKTTEGASMAFTLHTEMDRYALRQPRHE